VDLSHPTARKIVRLGCNFYCLLFFLNLAQNKLQNTIALKRQSLVRTHTLLGPNNETQLHHPSEESQESSEMNPG
jgi:hypothetical protein